MAGPPLLTVTRTAIVQAPPARVLAAFFDARDLAQWWQVVRSVTVPRPLGTYAIEWAPTDFEDDVLGRLGGAFHGTLLDYRASGTFFVAEAYWQPPEGDPIGPMALEVHCRPHGHARTTHVTVRQSAQGDGPRWKRYFELMDRGWASALEELKKYMEREGERTRTA